MPFQGRRTGLTSVNGFCIEKCVQPQGDGKVTWFFMRDALPISFDSFSGFFSRRFHRLEFREGASLSTLGRGK